MKRYTAIVSSKGQIVLPRAVRDRLGVQLGDQVAFLLDSDGIHVQPVRSEQQPFTAWLGAAPSSEGADQLTGESRHAGLTPAEIDLLRAGPGAQVLRLGLELDDC